VDGGEMEITKDEKEVLRDVLFIEKQYLSDLIRSDKSTYSQLKERRIERLRICEDLIKKTKVV
jgi:hypothetical protein